MTEQGPTRQDATGQGPSEQDATGQDWTDAHIARWTPVLPGLDPDIEGAVTRMQRFVKHIKRTRESSLADFGLQQHEFATLHALAAREGTASPSTLAADLDMAPASVTGRIDALEGRGLVRRTSSPQDRRRVQVELGEAGWEIWRGAQDVVGHEEYRLLGVLTADERRTLSTLLRRVLHEAEHAADGQR